MIKLILFITLFFGVNGFTTFCNTVNNKLYYNNTFEIINEKNPLKVYLQTLKNAPLINLPYGNKNVLKKYSTQWSMPDIKNTAQNENVKNLNSNYNCLDSFFYNDIQNRNQLIVEAKKIVLKKIVSADFVKLDEALNKNEEIATKVSAISFSNFFKTYSVIITGKQQCNNCEYAISQTENILINVDKQNNIIDKLIISSIVGSDLGDNSKFFFIDKNKTIHIKHFTSNELSISFKKYKQYKVMPDGHFAEILKK